MPANFVLGEKTSSTYPRGYACGFFSPAALLDGHFERASLVQLTVRPADISILPIVLDQV